MQQRLKKYTRDLNTYSAVASRQVTSISIAIIDRINAYKLLPTSLLIRLVPSHAKSTYRHLQQLYHKRLINRFAFMRNRNAGEFHYYLDSTDALDLLAASGINSDCLDRDEVKRNKYRAYSDVNNPARSEEIQGRLLFLKHEAMISRFHATLELACRQSASQIKLTDFQQGPVLWHKVEVPKLSYTNGQWREQDQTEQLPHRPDAFFTLSFPSDSAGREPLHFFYEADRHRTDTNKYNKKLRAHFHFVVKQKLHQQHYDIGRVRAVLTETVDDDWAERLRQAANHVSVSGSKPSPLFWFTTSRLFLQEAVDQQDRKALPAHLQRPDIIFKKIWASPVDDTLHSLLD